MTDAPPRVAHFFVDESGDLSLFEKSGRALIGRAGVSATFMIGVAEIPDPDHVQAKLDQLRADLLADPYFRGVPSMQPEDRKTALCFHAKDDLPEVRREVFRLLPGFGAKIFVAIRRKGILVNEARDYFAATGRKVTENQLYDGLVTRVFRDKLHRAEENRILFSIRGKSDRNLALARAIAAAKQNFERRWGKSPDRPCIIAGAHPSQSGGLQVIDYYLWALQRMYERGEDRFFESLAAGYRLIMDCDDTRQHDYGQYFT